ncbi:MAG: bifunctional diaminohydroxyphosphoribosylaminopyrimidine deaminase/5-amino-6-(5-phosphoribosylamino)uracil reductase RibD [Firmicutes bacterium]|nr:bifunctional diaminohydroxyphosphoribosylaminopyrimidine deaminase/5-amino-6-(5-phosphoribosylamino)uracil reductase RibD [Bacillota bacterium]
MSEHMRRALQLAKRGRYTASPNPMVGAVVVDCFGEIVGQGYHRRAGGPHAEVYALRQAGERARGGSLYVTLEPCNHQGRTPPCTEAIIAAGIQSVHIASLDPNPHVAGGGAERLRQQGIGVEVGDLQSEAIALNRPFMTWSTLGRPMVTLKAATSLDGKINGWVPATRYLSSAETLKRVHDLRRSHDAILVGIGTVIADDPSLTYRGKGKGRDPVRVIVDSHGRTPPSCRALQTTSQAPTLIYSTEDASVEWERQIFANGGEVVRVAHSDSGQVHLPSILHDLAERRILSVLVEGGATIHGEFLKQSLADQWISFFSPILIGDRGLAAVFGSPVPSATCELVEVRTLGTDLMVRALITR